MSHQRYPFTEQHTNRLHAVRHSQGHQYGAYQTSPQMEPQHFQSDHHTSLVNIFLVSERGDKTFGVCTKSYSTTRVLERLLDGAIV
jgi:hypothetical protein